MATGPYAGPLEQVDACCWRIPKSYKPGMRVDGLIFADDVLIEQVATYLGLDPDVIEGQ